MNATSQPLDHLSPSENVPLDPHSDSDVRQRVFVSQDPQANDRYSQYQITLDKLLDSIQREITDTLLCWIYVLSGFITLSRFSNSRWELQIAIFQSPFMALVAFYFSRSVRKYHIRTLIIVANVLRTSVACLSGLFIIMDIKCLTNDSQSIPGGRTFPVLFLLVALFTIWANLYVIPGNIQLLKRGLEVEKEMQKFSRTSSSN